MRISRPRPRCPRTGSRRRGGALLAVLWLAAALSAIAFSLANTVRGEIERTSTAVDGERGYYLATGAIDRAICYIVWGDSERNPDGSPRYWEKGLPRLHLQFPTGEAIVEIIPATAKLNINLAKQDELVRLLAHLGVGPGQAQEIAAAILDWRQPVSGGAPTFFDQYYLSRSPSFLAHHASFEEIEEVLLVKGITPELFYGTYRRDPQGRLVRRPGLKDCLSVFGQNLVYDVNTAEPATLAAIGLKPEAIGNIMARRLVGPIKSDEIGQLAQGQGAGKLVAGGISIYTLRATARLRLQDGRLSDLRRSVAAVVKFFGLGIQPPYQILRWYDQAPADTVAWP